MARAEKRRPVLVWRVVDDAGLQVLARRRQRAQGARGKAEGMVGDGRERGVVGTLRQAQQRVPELARPVQLGSGTITPPQPIQDRDQLGRLAHLLTQPVGLGIRVLHLGRCQSFRHLQGGAEGDMQRQGVLGPLRRLWQGLQQRDARAHVADGFQIGRAVAGVLARALPEGNGLLESPASV